MGNVYDNAEVIFQAEEITIVEYTMIMNALQGKLSVHASFTDMDGSITGTGKQTIRTWWGLKNSDLPLTIYEKVGDTERYFVFKFKVREGE
jgi:uncharacterized protein YbcI